jgi:uncharacterized membrane protein
MRHQGAELGFSLLPYIRLLFSPWVLLGTALLLFWLLSRMTLLGWADLSYVLPVTSASYALTVVAGWYFFTEKISWQHWMGTLMIMTGVTVVGLTRPNTTSEEHL